MKHFAIEAKHQGLRVPLPVVGMKTLLEQRKLGLEAQVAERFRQARATGIVANVTLLSAALRATKAQIARAADG